MTGPAACPRKLFEALETAENKNPKDSLQARCVADSATAVVKSHVFGALFFLGPASAFYLFQLVSFIQCHRAPKPAPKSCSQGQAFAEVANLGS
jgi:hypothetical protein